MDHSEATAPQNDSKDAAEPRNPAEIIKKEEKQKEKEKKYPRVTRYYLQAIEIYHRTLKKLQVLLSILCNRDLMSHYNHSPQMKKTDAAMMLMVVYMNLTYCYNMTDCIEEVFYSMNEVQTIVDAYFFDNHELKVAIGRMNDYVVKRVAIAHQFREKFEAVLEIRRIIIDTFKHKWGSVENQQPAAAELIVQDCLDNLYKKCFINSPPDQWIVAFQQKQGKKELRPPVKVEYGILITEMTEKETENNNKKKLVDSHDIPQPAFNERMRLDIESITKKEENEIKAELLQKLSSRSNSRREVRKAKIELDLREKRKREEALEDFKEFERIAPMIRMIPNEMPEIRDMNQVFADTIKVRYRSTDRFKREKK